MIENPYAAPRAIVDATIRRPWQRCGMWAAYGCVVVDLLVSALVLAAWLFVAVVDFTAGTPWGILLLFAMIAAAALAILADVLILLKHRLSFTMGAVAAASAVFLGVVMSGVLFYRYGQNASAETLNRGVVQTVARSIWNALYIAAILGIARWRRGNESTVA